MTTELNYNHLYYFWMVAREGSVTAASRELLVSQPTISLQLRDLERRLRAKLFERSARGLKLTAAGRTAYRYADVMFAAGQGLIRALRQEQSEPHLRLVVGVADAVPKELVYRMLSPALAIDTPVQIVCREDKADRLLADLVSNRLDLALVDAPLAASVQLRGENYQLLESGVSFMATPARARRLRKDFPRSLDGEPVLLPSDVTAMRTPLLEWFQRKGVRPVIVGEFDDVAAMAAFAREGAGTLVIPTVLEREMRAAYSVNQIGRTNDIRYRFYAVAAAELLQHPAVRAICRN